MQQLNRDTTISSSGANGTPATAQPVRYNASTRQASANADNTWACEVCFTTNQKAASFCKNCAEYRF